MGKLPALILVSFFTCFTITANAQCPASAQLSATPVECTLRPGQVHEFTIKVEENNFVQLVVDQRGIDVIVKVFSPAGKSLGEFDSPNGSDGPENVSFVAVAAGSYRISVGPLDPSSTTEGRYQIKLLELRQATNEELKTSKNQEGAKAKGLTLLTDIEGLIPQIKSAQTRITSQLQMAQILWESDQKRASKYLTDAMTGFKDYLATLDISNDDYFQQHQMCSQLRQEMIQTVMMRDPEAALNFLYSSVLPPDPNGNPIDQVSQDSGLELIIANQVMQKDPNRALQIARQNLKKGLSSNLSNILSELQNKKPELAAELANEIVGKLLNEKLLKNHEAAMLAINLLRLSQVSGKRSTAVQNPKNSPPPMLPEDKYSELFQKIVKESFAYSQSSTQSNGMERNAVWILLSGLQTFVADLDAFVPGGAGAVEKKLAQLNVQGIPQVGSQEAQVAVANSPADAALEAIEKAPQELQEQLYMQLAAREAMNGEGARATQIVNEHITNVFQRQQALANIQQQEMNRIINTGKVDDALRAVAAYRNPHDRAAHLTQIVNQIGQGQKRASAINFLEQARSMLGPSVQAQDENHMQALFEIARVYSRYDSKRSFEIIEPLIDQLNDLCAAMRTLDGFGAEGYEDDELNLRSGQPVANVAAQLSRVLGSLALVNFEGAKTEAERIRLPEVRLRAYLEIAQQTIQGVK